MKKLRERERKRERLSKKDADLCKAPTWKICSEKLLANDFPANILSVVGDRYSEEKSYSIEKITRNEIATNY